MDPRKPSGTYARCKARTHAIRRATVTAHPSGRGGHLARPGLSGGAARRPLCRDRHARSRFPDATDDEEAGATPPWRSRRASWTPRLGPRQSLARLDVVRVGHEHLPPGRLGTRPLAAAFQDLGEHGQTIREEIGRAHV